MLNVLYIRLDNNMRLLSRLKYKFSIKAYNENKNYYKILNISEQADQQQIKKAFRELAKKYHPDTVKGKEQQFKEVNEAYQVLSDDTIKKQYDQVRYSNQQQSNRHNPNNNPFNQHQSNGYRQQPKQNYRGYQPQEGWKNKNFRQQFMYDLYRQQENEANRRNFEESQRQEIQRLFRERMRQAMNNNPNDTIRQYNEQAKKKQAQARKKYQQSEQRRREAQYQEYRKYQDDNYKDVSDKFAKQMNKMADNIAGGVKDALRMGEQLKEWWTNFKKNNKR